MQCPRCSYELWNTPSRQCPECGRPFEPSEFRFAPNTVQFVCPHCRQAYYGTDANGHLEPPSFDCVSCGEHLEMNQMLLLPADGVGRSTRHVAWNPWVDARNRGVVTRWFATIGYALVLPNRLIEGTPTDAPTSSAWWFALITLAIYSAGTLLLFLVFLGADFLMGGGDPTGVLISVAVWLAFFLVPLGFIAIWGPVTHGLLLMTGSTRGGLGRTYQCLFYGSGAAAILAVPCIGAYFFYLAYAWWVVSSTIMVAIGQRVHGGRAALATLALPGLAAAGVGSVIVFSVFYASTRQPQYAAPPSYQPPPVQTTPVQPTPPPVPTY